MIFYFKARLGLQPKKIACENLASEFRVLSYASAKNTLRAKCATIEAHLFLIITFQIK